MSSSTSIATPPVQPGAFPATLPRHLCNTLLSTGPNATTGETTFFVGERNALANRSTGSVEGTKYACYHILSGQRLNVTFHRCTGKRGPGVTDQRGVLMVEAGGSEIVGPVIIARCSGQRGMGTKFLPWRGIETATGEELWDPKEQMIVKLSEGDDFEVWKEKQEQNASNVRKSKGQREEPEDE